MSSVDKSSINDYANSMFRYEHIHDDWVASCAKYIISIFGEDLRGKTVIDYAFGRGNWSLAFLRAGAKQVIAIDASEDNVKRFSNFCVKHSIRDILIEHGNIVINKIDHTADLIWLYGILHHIEKPSLFLESFQDVARDAHSLLYLYYYNSGSLRELTVQACRQLLTFSSESEFAEKRPLFIRNAALRARDDLTAPWVDFKSSLEVTALARSANLYPIRFDDDFQTFLHGKAPEEFKPHQLLCSFNGIDKNPHSVDRAYYETELYILSAIVTELLTIPLSKSIRHALAIGIFNTHFAYLLPYGDISKSLEELFIYLVSQLTYLGITDTENSLVDNYLFAFRANLSGDSQAIKSLNLDSKFGSLLTSSRLRL